MIRFNPFHPSLRELLAVAAERPGDPVGPAARHHAQGCSRCQRIVADVRMVEQAAADFKFPVFDGERVLSNIQRRIERRGPGHVATQRRVTVRRWAPPVMATVFAGLVIFAVVVRNPPQLVASATAGTMALLPAAPLRGARVAVRYVPREDLRRHDRLHLRARLRSTGDVEFNAAVPVRIIAVLTRQASGEFHGAFTLDDSIVYAAFAAEAPDGTAVDARNGAPWELVVHNENGNPSLDGLEQRGYDLLRRDWEGAAETARRQTELYPHDPMGWQQRWSFESRVAAGGARDSLRSAVVRVFDSLDVRYADASELPGRVLYGMHALAITAANRIRAQFWRTRLSAASADSAKWRTDSWLVRARSIDLNATGSLADVRIEAEHERLFAASRTRDPLVISQARVAAFARRDGPALVKWTGRAVDLSPELALPLLADLHEFPAVHAEALSLIAQTDAAFTLPGKRPLEAAVPAMRIPRERAARLARAARGRIHLAQGDTAGAQAMFLQAGEQGWDPELFRALADLLQATRNRAALGFAALAAVDPSASTSFVDSVRTRYARDLNTVEWTDLLAGAEQQMLRRVAEDELPGRYLADAWIRRGDEDVTVAELTAGEVTFIAYWSRNCGPSLASLAALESTVRRLRALGVRVITLSKQDPGADTEEFLRKSGYTFPVYFESRKENRLTHIDLRMTGTPSFVFVDRHGRLRHQANRLGPTLAQAKALLAEP